MRFEIKKLISNTVTVRPISLYINFHSNTGLHGAFVYGYLNTDDEGLRNVENIFPRSFARSAKEAAWENCTLTFPKERQGAGCIIISK